jgi:hypothetical protein
LNFPLWHSLHHSPRRGPAIPRTRYRICETEYLDFLTSTVVGWLPVVPRPEAVAVVVESSRFLPRERGFRLFEYVLLENHLHLVASAPDLAGAVQSFTMSTARQDLDLLQCHGAKVLLRSFAINHRRRRHRCRQRSSTP